MDKRTPPGPIDTAVLEMFHERVRTHLLIDQINGVRKNDALTTLILDLDDDRYPQIILSASLEIQWYENDKYNFHYREKHADGTV